MLAQNSSDEKVKDALYQVVLSDKDQTNRIEALNILEVSNGEYADKALRSISDEDNEYFKFKAANLDK